MMPRIVRPWDIVGALTPEMAELTGFAAGTPICGGAGDTMQSMIGSGVMQPGSAVDVAGTCSMFCVSTSGIVPELSQPGNGLIFNSGTLPNTYFYWGYIRTGGLALRWFKDNVCDQAEDGGYFDELNRRATGIAPGSDGVLFLPYLTGGTDDIQDATGCFLNLTMDSDQALLWHAVLEAIGYDYMEIAKLYASAGVDMSRLTITEGGSRSDIWNQMKADMLDARAVTLAEAGSRAHRLPLRRLRDRRAFRHPRRPGSQPAREEPLRAPRRRARLLRNAVRPARKAREARPGRSLPHAQVAGVRGSV